MSKAVLVMDMPKRCDKCNLFLMIKQKNMGVCLAGPPSGETNIEYNPKHEASWRPDFCPLRELPEKEYNDNEYSGTEEIVREIANEVLKENGCELCKCDDASVTDWDGDEICTVEDFVSAFWEKSVEKILNVVETQGR